MNSPVITIDGPGGSGKGTVSRLVASRLGFHLLDSGALYRLLALASQQQGLEDATEQVLARLALNLDVHFDGGDENEDAHVFLGDKDVSNLIRTETIGVMASKIAALPQVRTALLERQRHFLQDPGLVADGRDMGTVVFPDAPYKVFLDASVDERAQRRYKQLKEKGITASLLDLMRDISDRDERDRNRPVAPLKAAADALIIDSTGIPVQQVVSQVLGLLNK